MASPITSPWRKETIPNEDLLYMRVHKNLVQSDGSIAFLAFKNHGDPRDPSIRPGMSTDWQEYSTPEECRQRASLFGKDPSKYEVIQINVGRVRQIPGQEVEHTPIYEPHSTPPILNRAHTDVYGDKTDEEVRLGFINAWEPAIPFGS
jgi:hypothetical protein